MFCSHLKANVLALSKKNFSFGMYAMCRLLVYCGLVPPFFGFRPYFIIGCSQGCLVALLYRTYSIHLLFSEGMPVLRS